MVPTTIWKIKFTSAKSYTMTGDPLSKNLTNRLCNWGLPMLRIPIVFTFSHSKSAKFSVWRHHCSITPDFCIKTLVIVHNRHTSCTCSSLSSFHPIRTFFTFVSLMLARRGRPLVRVLVDALEITIFIIFPARAILLIYLPYISNRIESNRIYQFYIAIFLFVIFWTVFQWKLFFILFHNFSLFILSSSIYILKNFLFRPRPPTTLHSSPNPLHPSFFSSYIYFLIYL
jgi:hypothetical protein